MAELTLAYKARSYSTGTLGRAICNARTHHFVSDDTGGSFPRRRNGGSFPAVYGGLQQPVSVYRAASGIWDKGYSYPYRTSGCG